MHRRVADNHIGSRNIIVRHGNNEIESIQWRLRVLDMNRNSLSARGFPDRN